MVIFHSYVSLPEGKSLNSEKKKLRKSPIFFSEGLHGPSRTCDGQVEHVDALRAYEGQLHVPGALQPHEDVQQHGQQDVLLPRGTGWIF